jgi:hypothetical protein
MNGLGIDNTSVFEANDPVRPSGERLAMCRNQNCSPGRALSAKKIQHALLCRGVDLPCGLIGKKNARGGGQSDGRHQSPPPAVVLTFWTHHWRDPDSHCF